MIGLLFLLQSLAVQPVQAIPVPDQTDRAGVAVTGDLYLLSSSLNTIYRLSKTGEITSQYGRKGTGSQFLNQPVSIWCSNDLLVHVADRKNHRITILSRELGLVGLLEGVPSDGLEERFRYPGGVVVTSAGDWYILDTENNRIIRMNPRQTVTSIIGDLDAGSGRLIQPDRLLLTENRLFVHDRAQLKWQEFDTFGNPLGSWPDSTGTPVSVLSTLWFVDQNGQLSKGDVPGSRYHLVIPEGSQILDVLSRGNVLYVLTNRLLLTYLLDLE